MFSQFPAFFKLYATAPNLGRALMDMCFSRVRFAALETVIDAFKSSKVKLLYAASVLGFLVRLEGEAGSQGQPAVVSEDTAVDVNVHNVEGSVMLPGCAKTIHMGKHPAQVGITSQALICIADGVCILAVHCTYCSNMSGCISSTPCFGFFFEMCNLTCTSL